MSYYANDEFIVTGSHEDYVKEVGVWLKENTKPGAKIMMDLLLSPSLYLFSGGNIEFYSLPVTNNPKLLSSGRIYNEIILGNKCAETKHGKLLFVWKKRKRNKAPQRWIFLLNEKALLRDIKRNNIDYVIINNRVNITSQYFSKSPYFTELLRGAIKVYKVKRPVNIFPGFSTVVDEDIPDLIRKLYKSNRKLRTTNSLCADISAQ